MLRPGSDAARRHFLLEASKALAGHWDGVFDACLVGVECGEFVRERRAGFGNILVGFVLTGVLIIFLMLTHFVVDTFVGQVVLAKVEFFIIGPVVVDDP